MALDVFSAKKHGDESLVVDPRRTAVLVVDMLNEFCKEGGAMVLPGYEALIGPQTRLIGSARASWTPTAGACDASASSPSEPPIASRAGGVVR